MTGGYYLMRRGWMDHPALDRGEPYSRREAWCWLIEHACYRPSRIDINGRLVPLARGQLCYSNRQLAKEWGWSEAKVRRFLCVLKTDSMIDAGSDAGKNIVTICNYEKYQSGNSTGDAATDAGSDAGATQERRTKEIKERKERKDDVVSSRADARDPEPEAKAPPDPALLRSVGERILDTLGADPARWMGHFGPVQAWLAAGADVDADILPTVERIGRTKPDGWCPGNLTYFDKPILQAMAERNRDLSAEVVDLHPGAAPNRGPPGGLTAAEVRRRDDAAMREWEAVKRMALDEDEVNGDTAAG